MGSRPSSSSVLIALPKARLVELGRELAVALPVSSTKEQQAARLVKATRIDLQALARLLTRDELKQACRAHGLEDSGRSRVELASRLVGGTIDPSALSPALFSRAREGSRELPEAGDIVSVRHRQYLVEEVVARPLLDEATRVRLVCLDDDNQGRLLEVLWELELGARRGQRRRPPTKAVLVALWSSHARPRGPRPAAPRHPHRLHGRDPAGPHPDLQPAEGPRLPRSRHPRPARPAPRARPRRPLPPTVGPTWSRSSRPTRLPGPAPRTRALAAFEDAVIDRLFALNAHRAEQERLSGAAGSGGAAAPTSKPQPAKKRPAKSKRTRAAPTQLAFDSQED